MLDRVPDPEPLSAGSILRRRLVLVASMLAVFMSAVEATIVATAMPTIVADLGGFRLFSWVFATYLLTQAVTIPIYGRLADLLGRKRVFYAGAGLFLVGSTLCGFARGMVALILFRALQGLGAGAIQPIATTIVGDIFPSEERSRAQGYLSSVWGIASVIGPLLGAFLVQHLSWAVVFWVNLPIGAAAIVLLALFFEERPQPRRHQIDYLGSALLMLGAGGLMLALVQAGNLGAGALAGLVGIAAAALAGLVLQERRTAEPMLPLEVWRNRTIRASNLACFAIGAVLMGAVVFLPTYLQGVLGRSAVVSGFVLTVMSATWSAAAVATGRLLVHTTYRLSAAAGSVALILGSLVLIGLVPPRGTLWASAGGFLIGIGMGICNTTFLISVQASVGRNMRGAATSSNIFMRSVGQSMGAALFGAVLNFGVLGQLSQDGAAIDRLMEPSQRQGLDPALIARLTSAVAGSLHEVFLIAGLVATAAFALTFWLPSGVGPRDAR